MYLSSQHPIGRATPACAGLITLCICTQSLTAWTTSGLAVSAVLAPGARGIALALRFAVTQRVKEAVMTRRMAVVLTGFLIIGGGRAGAQEGAPGPGTVEVTVIPGGGIFYTSGDKGPSFGNYNLGGAVAYNINRIFGIEGEVGATVGVPQDLQ